MNEWFSLVKKEFRMTRSSLPWGLAIIVVAGFLDLYLAYHNGGRPGIAIIFALLVVFGHIFYLLAYMLKSLSTEWNQTAHLWLQLPRSGWSLLSAKLTAGFISMLLSFAITCAFTLWVASVEISHLARSADAVQVDAIWSMIFQLGLLISLLIVMGSVYTGLWGILISVTMAFTRVYLKKGAFLIGFGIFLIPTWGMGLFQDSIVYDRLVRWGNLNYTPPEVNPFVNLAFQNVYAGELLFYTIVAVAVFYLSGWILENKVEV